MDKGTEETYNTGGLSWLWTDRLLELSQTFCSLSGFRESEIQICEVTEGANTRRSILAKTHKRCNKQKVVGGYAYKKKYLVL